MEVYKAVSEFYTKTEIPLKIIQANQPSTKNYPVRTANYLARIAAKCFLLLVVITTLELRPIDEDHIITNSVNTLRYISAQTVCSQTLKRSLIPKVTLITTLLECDCVAHLVFALK